MHRRAERHLKKRFTKARLVPNVSTRHGFITLQNKDILIKVYSNAPDGEYSSISNNYRFSSGMRNDHILDKGKRLPGYRVGLRVKEK